MDHGRSDSPRPERTTRIAAALFLSFLTVQSAFIVLAPTLPDVARDFGVSTGTAGQLRTVAAVAGVATALTLAPLGRVVGIRRLLVTGLGALAAGSIASALAPTFALLAVGQVILGMGGAAVLSAGLAAASDWPAREQRTRVLAWTTVGQPAAWVLGLPAVGALSHLGWRWGWIVVPAAAAAALAVLPCGPSRNAPVPAAVGSAWADPRVRRWALGEVMAYAGWGGTLVYAGALLSESYNLGTSTVGLLLGAAAVAYFPGTFAARRRLEGDLRALLAGLAIALAIGAAAFGALRPSAWVSTGLFAVLILLAGARGIAGSAFGLNAAPEQKVTIGSIRAGATQLGYLVGAAAGGVALDLGGYPVVGLTLAGFFAAAAVPHLSLGFRRRSLRGARRALAPIYAEWSRGNWRAEQPALAWGFSPEFPGSDGVHIDSGPRSDRLAEWLRQWRDWRVEPKRFVNLPCRVVVMTRYSGRGRASGVAVDTAGAHVWTIREGKPVALEVFADRELALQAGARPCGG